MSRTLAAKQKKEVTRGRKGGDTRRTMCLSSFTNYHTGHGTSQVIMTVT